MPDGSEGAAHDLAVYFDDDDAIDKVATRDNLNLQSFHQ